MSDVIILSIVLFSVAFVATALPGVVRYIIWWRGFRKDEKAYNERVRLRQENLMRYIERLETSVSEGGSE